MFRRSYPEIRSFFLTKVRYLVFAGVSSDNVIFSKKDRYRGRDLDKKNRSLTDCLCQLRMADLIDSLQSSQDFLRRYSLRCLVVGTIPFVKSIEARRANRMDALSHGPMTVIVLATTGLLACAFRIYVHISGYGTRMARGHLVPELMDKAMGHRRTNAPTSWVPGRLIGMSPNGLRTRRSRAH